MVKSAQPDYTWRIAPEVYHRGQDDYQDTTRMIAYRLRL
jgi:hypothetical protein